MVECLLAMQSVRVRFSLLAQGYGPYLASLMESVDMSGSEPDALLGVGVQVSHGVQCRQFLTSHYSVAVYSFLAWLVPFLVGYSTSIQFGGCNEQ